MATGVSNKLIQAKENFMMIDDDLSANWKRQGSEKIIRREK
jgi:hypothetical protein